MHLINKTPYLYTIKSITFKHFRMTINFAKIKHTIVSQGLAYASDVDEATEKVVFVHGEHCRDESIIITRVMAGWRVAGLCKTISVKPDLDIMVAPNEDALRQLFQEKLPDATLFFEIL